MTHIKRINKTTHIFIELRYIPKEVSTALLALFSILLTPALIAWIALSTWDDLPTANVSYNFVTRLISLCVDRSKVPAVTVNAIVTVNALHHSVGSMELNNRQFLQLPPLAWKFMNEANVDLVLLRSRLLLRTFCAEGIWSQAQHKRRMLRRHQPKCYHQLYCMCTISSFALKEYEVRHNTKEGR